MSRQNKVNPGQYTQRGRLTQDDAARELKQQRSIGSQHTWQPVQKDQMPRPRLSAKDNDADRDETSEDNEDQATPSSGKAQPAARVTRTTASKKTAPAKAAAKQSKTAKSNPAKKTAGKAKAAKSAMTSKPAAKRAATKTARKAVLARNVGGGGPKPRQTAKRRKN